MLELHRLQAGVSSGPRSIEEGSITFLQRNDVCGVADKRQHLAEAPDPADIKRFAALSPLVPQRTKHIRVSGSEIVLHFEQRVTLAALVDDIVQGVAPAAVGVETDQFSVHRSCRRAAVETDILVSLSALSCYGQARMAGSSCRRLAALVASKSNSHGSNRTRLTN